MLNGQTSLISTDLINGVMVAVNPAYAVQGSAYGPSPLGYDTYAAQPTTPPFTGPTAMTAGYTAGGADTANNTAATAAASAPFNPRVSPLLWSIGMLFVGLIGLRLIHWH